MVIKIWFLVIWPLCFFHNSRMALWFVDFILSFFVLSSRCTFHRWSRFWWFSLFLPYLLLQVSPLLSLFFFFFCVFWCRCVKLVFWSFGFFASIDALYMLVNLWGAFYFLDGGCPSNTLCTCLLVSWWLYSSNDYSFSNSFFGFLW